jgi:GNAT superfamily N-acetyltransferase
MADHVVRPVVLEDAEAFVTAYERAWDATLAPIAGRRLGELSPFDERVAGFRTTFAEPPPGAGVWVAERDREIVGVAVRVGSELRALYVVPEAWGTGVAGALMDVALDAMRADGADEATLWVGESNARARRYYEREGWEPTGETKESPLGPPELRYRHGLAP